MYFHVLLHHVWIKIRIVHHAWVVFILLIYFRVLDLRITIQNLDLKCLRMNNLEHFYTLINHLYKIFLPPKNVSFRTVIFVFAQQVSSSYRTTMPKYYIQSIRVDGMPKNVAFRTNLPISKCFMDCLRMLHLEQSFLP